MNKTLTIFGNSGFKGEHILVIAGVVSGGTILTDGLVSEDVHVGLVGAGQEALTQVGEVGARDARVG